MSSVEVQTAIECRLFSSCWSPRNLIHGVDVRSGSRVKLMVQFQRNNCNLNRDGGDIQEDWCPPYTLSGMFPCSTSFPNQIRHPTL